MIDRTAGRITEYFPKFTFIPQSSEYIKQSNQTLGHFSIWSGIST